MGSVRLIATCLLILFASGSARAKEINGAPKYTIGSCLSRALDKFLWPAKATPELRLFMNKANEAFAPLRQKEYSAGLPLLKAHLDSLGIKNRWIRRRWRKIGIEILPEGDSPYNRFARRITEEGSVDRVIFTPGEPEGEVGDRSMQVTPVSLLLGTPEPIKLYRYLRAIERGTPLKASELEEALLLSKDNLDSIGVENSWIEVDGKKVAIEILPTGKSIYNRHVRSLKEKLGVDHVFFNPRKLAEEEIGGSFLEGYDGEKTIQVSARSILVGRPELAGVHEARHAKSWVDKLRAPGRPWAAEVKSLGMWLRKNIGSDYGNYQSFDEVITNSGDLDAILKQLQREWRESPASEAFRDTAGMAAGKAHLLAEVSERVVDVSNDLAPAFAQIKEQLQKGGIHAGLGPFSYSVEVEGHAVTLQVAPSVESAGKYPNGRSYPEKWIFNFNEVSTVTADSAEKTTPLFRVSVPSPLLGKASTLDQIKALQESFAVAAALARKQKIRATKISILLEGSHKLQAPELERIMKQLELLTSSP